MSSSSCYYPQNVTPENIEQIVRKREFIRASVADGFTLRGYEHLSDPQAFIQRFASPFTFYDEILLFWGMGTGKTCAAASVAELGMEEGTFSNAVILAPSEGLLNSFARQVVLRCATPGKYVVPDNADATAMRKRLRGSNYLFYTYDKFIERLRIGSDALRDRLDNSIFIMDEVHNLTSSAPSITSARNTLTAFLAQLQNRKILMLTGTPMRDSFAEIVPLFEIMGLGTAIGPPPREDRDSVREFQVFLGRLTTVVRGRVSVVPPLQSLLVRRVYGGSALGDTSILLQRVNPSPFQARAIETALSSRADTLLSAARDASLFVYPDGTWGSTGEKTYIRQTGTRVQAIGALDRALSSARSLEESVAPLSAKYARVLRIIKNAQERKECVMIFSSAVRGSGLIVLELLLQRAGLVPAKPGRLQPRERYMVITGDTSPAQGDSLMRTQRSRSNVFGSLVRVVLFSAAASEGYSFNHIRHVEILTPAWNLSSIKQAEGRGIRAFSHAQLLERLGDTPIDVRIARVALSGPIAFNGLSVDEYVYYVASRKERFIENVERALATVAVGPSEPPSAGSGQVVDDQTFDRFWAHTMFDQITTLVRDIVVRHGGSAHYSHIPPIADWSENRRLALALFINLQDQRPIERPSKQPLFLVSIGDWFYLSPTPFTFGPVLPPFTGLITMQGGGRTDETGDALWAERLYATTERIWRERNSIPIESELSQEDKELESIPAADTIGPDIIARARALTGGLLGLRGPDDKFCIRDVGTDELVYGKGNRRSAGRICSTFPRSTLLAMAERAGVELPKRVTVRNLCDSFKEYFIKHDLLLFDPKCGSSNKRRL